MKKIYLYALVAITFLGITGCDITLPYPIDEVTRGVAIDIARVPGSEPVLFDGITTGNFGIVLSIPHQQGDFSMMKHAQLMAILTDATGRTSQVVVDNITNFTVGAFGMPQHTIMLDLADIYARFGRVSPTVGETLMFVPNVVLNCGRVIPGWSPLFGTTGLANQAVTWTIGEPGAAGRGFSNHVAYPVVCQLVLDDFVGTATVTGNWTTLGNNYEVEITRTSENQLSIAGFFDGYADNPLVLNVNTEEFTVSFASPNPILVLDATPWFGGTWGDLRFEGPGTGRIDACTFEIILTVPRILFTNATGGVGALTGPFTFTISMNRPTTTSTRFVSTPPTINPPPSPPPLPPIYVYIQNGYEWGYGEGFHFATTGTYHFFTPLRTFYFPPRVEGEGGRGSVRIEWGEPTKIFMPQKDRYLSRSNELHTNLMGTLDPLERAFLQASLQGLFDGFWNHAPPNIPRPELPTP